MKLVRIGLVVGLTGFMLAGYQNCSQNKFDSGSADRTSASVSSVDGGSPKDPGLPVSGGGTTTDNPKPTIDIGMNAYDPATMSAGAQICVQQVKLIKSRVEDANRRLASVEEVVAQTVPNGFGGLSVILASGRSVAQDLGGLAVNVAPQGTLIASLPFPMGKYDELQFALKPGCGGSSLTYVNAAGKTITLNETATLKFKGKYALNAANPQLIVAVQPLMTALAKAKDAKEAKDVLENGCTED